MVTVTVKNKKTAIQAKGSLLDVTIEAMMIVNNLYNAIARANPAEGERFREMIRHGDDVWQLKRDAASFSGVLIVTPDGESL